MSPRASAVALLALAAAHTVPALVIGAQDAGDYSLLWVALPFVVLTVLAAVSVELGWQVAAVVLTSLAVGLALLATPLYLLGLLHLGQATVAVVFAARTRPYA